MYREHTQSWPAALQQYPTMRYRDNFFVGLASPDSFDMSCAAVDLNALLNMPVTAVSVGSTVRCLELRISFTAGEPVRSVLAFRTDEDRQGESHDVESWPAREDPRTPMLLPGLLHGLAAKLRFYTAEGATGYTATIRGMVAFLKAKGYPSAWWRRPFGLALLRVGADRQVLPRSLKVALGQVAELAVH